MLHSFFERKYDKVLTFNIVHFTNFEIRASLLLAPHLTVSKFNKCRGRLLYDTVYDTKGFYLVIMIEIRELAKFKVIRN